MFLGFPPNLRLYTFLLLSICFFACNQEKPSNLPVSPELKLPQDALTLPIHGIKGGTLITGTLNSPESFNPLLFYDAESQTFNQLTGAGLLSMNLQTQEVQPALAKSWSQNGLTWTFDLRKGIRWSDNFPFTADDVLFTMGIVNDSKISSAAQDALTIDGKQIEWSKQGDHQVTAKLPVPYAPFLRQLDGATLPILPKHKLEALYKAGKFQEAMPLSMRPEDYVCLGPFVLEKYIQGQSLTLKRNPLYWKVDEKGERLPYLDRIVFRIFNDIRQLEITLKAGNLDTYYNVRPEQTAEMATPGNNLKIMNLGAAFESDQFFFNQNGGTNPKTKQPYVDPIKRKWFVDPHFRRAISFAINRQSLVQVALYGKGFPANGPETPGNFRWFNNKLPAINYDPKKALQELEDSGFYLRNNSLFDKNGNPVSFALSTNAGNAIRATEGNLIASDLKKIGITVNFSTLDFNTLVGKITNSFDFEGALLGLSHDDIDPSGSMNLWLSSGSLHFWWPLQKHPQTNWESRIDELMKMQIASSDYADRKKYYDEVQSILVEQQPIIFTVTQQVYVAAKSGIGNLKPSVARHRTLWNAEELYWKK